MSDYSSQTVPQLKELLKAKGLPIDGKKADLVQRLTEADESSSGAPVTSESAAPEPETETQQPETKSETNDATTVEPAQEGSGEEKKEEKPKPKVLSPEERKQLAVELLTKKIQRAEKFGDEAAAETARKDLARVEKFGVEVGTALAKEIGLVDKNLNLGLRNFSKKHSRGHHGHRNRGFKPNHRR